MLKTFVLSFLVSFFLNNTCAQAKKEAEDSMMLYYGKGDYYKAVFYAKRVVELNGKDINISIPSGAKDYTEAINNLASLYQLLGKYDSSFYFHKQSIAIRKKILGEYSEEYAASLNNLATVYSSVAKYDTALVLFNQMLPIRKKVLGENHPDYISSFGNIAMVYKDIGNYAEAELLFLKELEIQNKVLGKENEDYILTLNNLAVLYGELGNYINAEKLLSEAVPIRKKISGELHPEYARVLNNLGVNLIKKGEYEAGLPLLLKASEIRKKVLGENNVDYANSLDNLAKYYRLVHLYVQAKEMQLRTIEIREKVIGKTHPDYAASLNNFGLLYYELDSLSLARDLFEKALLIYEDNKIVNSLYADILIQTSSIDFLLGNKNILEKNAERILDLEKEMLTNKLDFLSENELLLYLKERSSFLNLLNSIVCKYNNSNMKSSIFNSILYFKNVSLQNVNTIRNQILNSNNDLLINLLQNFKENKAFLNKTLSQPIAKRNINTDSLSNICNQQEKELLRNSTEYRGMKEKLNITWQDVRNGLNENDVAVEFVRFKNIKRKIAEKDTFYYAAMLLRKQATVPVFIKLFEESKLKNALKTFAYKAASKYDATKNNNKEDIYTLLWQPLEPYLKNTKTIYFAPDGLLHNIAFAAIPYKNNLLLSDKYNLVQLTSTRQIAIKEKENIIPASIALFGGINYNRQNVDTNTAAVADPYSYVYLQNRSGAVDSFSYLPNTLREVQNIKKSMEVKQKSVLLFSGDKATETAFKNLSNKTSPSVIHFATHGFTIIDTAKNYTTTNTFKVSDNPLLRSGLVLAGGNKGWQGKANANEDDGILTALEISAAQLQNTQLAVLSACETGTGELRGSEGIFGLQRAFKLAGVNYIMASLWQVPDKETAEFMNTFYNTWLTGKTIRQAFLATQQTMRKKYAPYYWAGFTLVQ